MTLNGCHLPNPPGRWEVMPKLKERVSGSGFQPLLQIAFGDFRYPQTVVRNSARRLINRFKRLESIMALWREHS